MHKREERATFESPNVNKFVFFQERTGSAFNLLICVHLGFTVHASTRVAREI